MLNFPEYQTPAGRPGIEAKLAGSSKLSLTASMTGVYQPLSFFSSEVHSGGIR